MEIPMFAVVYAAVFIAAEMIWLITIRNRNIILVSCATILIGVQGLSVIVIRDRFLMGNQYLMGYLFKFFWIDILLLFSLWLSIYGLPRRSSNKIQALGTVENKSNLFSSLDHIIASVHPDFRIILLIISFAIAILTIPFGILAILPIFWPLLIGFPSYLTYSPLFQHLPPGLIRAVGRSDFALLIGWILYSSLVVPIILTKRSVWIVLYLIFIFLLINNVVGCQRSLDVSW